MAWQDAPVWTQNGEQGVDQRSPDLSALVQAVVDREDWARGGALNFMLSGTGTRTAEAYEGGGSEQAPKLMVTYELPEGVSEARGVIVEDAGTMDHGSSDLEIVDEDAGQRQAVGLRYADLQVPAGAEILSARVQFTTDEDDKNIDPFRVSIAAEAADDSAAFSDEFGDLTARPLTEATAEWADIPAWEIEHESGPAQRTTDLSAVVQEVVDREGWSSGNALSLVLTGEGQRSAESRDGEPEMAPELWVTYRDGAEEPTEPGEPTDPTDPTSPEEPAHFTDNTDEDAWYFAPVRWLQLEEITMGYADGSFGVRRDITRGESLAFVFRYLDPETDGDAEDFSDVDEHNVFFDPIAWAASNGITEGYSDGEFKSTRSVTRGEFASFLFRAVQPDVDGAPATSFPDVPADSAHHAAVAWLADQGLVDGYTDGTYREITRAEVEKILFNVHGTLDG